MLYYKKYMTLSDSYHAHLRPPPPVPSYKSFCKVISNLKERKINANFYISMKR